MMEKQYLLQKEKGENIENKIEGLIKYQREKLEQIEKTIKLELPDEGPLSGYKTRL